MTASAIAGVDGCRGGWLAVSRLSPQADPQVTVFAEFADIVAALPGDTMIAVDMPIGLPDRIARGGRGPERLVRPLLGQRQSSVFSIPARAAVYATDYSEACRLALETSDPPRKVSKQAFFLFEKIRQIDRLLIDDVLLRRRLIEVHPELAFWRLNGGAAMQLPKKVKSRVSPPGMAERAELLERCGLSHGFLQQKLPGGAGRDDLIDAAAVMLIAERHIKGLTKAFPDPPPQDAFGIEVAIRV